MPAGAKINNTLNGGYHMPEDFNAAKLQRYARIRQRDEEERLRAKGLHEKSKRVTFMMPFTVVCKSCNKHIAKGTKLYVNVSEAPEKYLGTIKVHQLLLRCPMPGCNNMIKLIVNPKTRSYEVASGGKALGVPTEAELLERLKVEEEMKTKKEVNNGGSKGNSNRLFGDDNNNQDNLASFEEMQQRILEESARLDALGDDYIDEQSQVAKIKQARKLQQQNEDAAEKLNEEEERMRLFEEFQAAKKQNRALLAQDERIANFGNEDFVNDENENDNEENDNNGKKEASSNSFREAEKRAELQLKNAFADSIALLSTFESQPQNQQQTQSQHSAKQLEQQQQQTSNVKKPSLLGSMFSDDDDDE